MVDFTQERVAKLFEAGSYPDKEIDVTEEDLDAIAASFTEAPIGIEHQPTPFDRALGMLKSVYRKGKELFGLLSFTDAAWELIKSTGQRALSIGLKRDKSGIAEVSLVREPRIADARVFSDGLVGFSSELPTDADPPPAEAPASEPTTEVATMAEEVKTVETPVVEMSKAEQDSIIQQLKAGSADAALLKQAADELVRYRTEYDAVMREAASSAKAAVATLQRSNMETLVARFAHEGKLTPASMPYAQAIIATKPLSGVVIEDQMVTFAVGDATETCHIAEAFIKFLEMQPPVVSFAELLKNQAENAEFTAEDARMCEALNISKEQWLSANGRKAGG